MLPPSFRRGPRAALAVLAVLGSTFLLASSAADVPWPGPAPAGPPAPSRGALLYDNHCIECHTAQVHWRDRQQARDWATLKAEVLRWQAAACLAWTDAEVEAVTDYLNDTIYHFAAPQEQARARSPATAE
jgi:mono/diheme cytochrome c family protein